MSSTEKPGKLNFTPVSEGLGFHPFSNGLPYAPVGKTQRTNAPLSSPVSSSGAGATAAGPSSFSYPQAPVIHTPQIPKTQPQPFSPPLTPDVLGKPIAANSKKAEPQKSPTHVAPSESEISLAQENTPGFFYLIKRTFAFGIDVSLNGLLISAGWLAVLWDQVQEWDFFLQPKPLTMVVILFVVFQWGLFTIQEVLFKNTFGKQICGLRINGSPWQILMGNIWFIPSLGFSGLGVLWALFDSSKRNWHDRAAGIAVVEMAKL